MGYGLLSLAMKTRNVLSAGLVVGALVAAPGAWAAVVLPVVNGGFESPGGGATPTVPAGWSYTG